ncbi:B-cell receptor CD22-like isoform X3 [Cyprinus carpio]|uniref:B-cell receptor CD22-like isoform X3 n=1 Tax=Cyprinus carpio TaxID=7962 RepID=A0A9Q9WFZ6_CYPCA|nr:B-cell receptor CD22-like isoform X3 [Cyprinus carpio]
MGSGALALILLLMSFIHAGLTQERPKPVVKVSPDERVFRGETVTLTCDIQRAGDIQWTYSWFKDGYTFYPYPTTTTEIRFTADYSAEYSCRGERSDSQRSDTSAAVTLTVSDSSKSTLTVTPDSPVFSGETVNLTCVIETYSYGWRIDRTYDWRYEWYKDSVMLQTSGRYTVNRDTLTIRGVITSDQGQYWCRGQIRSVWSSFSSAVSLSVKDSPRSTLTVTPDSPVFTGETVNLTCVIETYSNWRWRIDQTYGWRYEWYKDSVMLQTSDRYTVNRDTLTIRGVITSDQDQYWCRGQRDKRPNSSQSRSAVNLTVMDLPRSTLTVTPDSPVFTGETVTLKCVIETYSNWRYEWYKGTNNSVMLQSSDRYTVNGDTLSIKALNESDLDQYWCRGQRDERPNSSQESNRIHLSVKDASSSLLVTAVVLGSSVCLLIFISLLLLWRYKKNKDQQHNINQTSVPNQSAESQPENSPLQSAGPDHIYDDVTEVKKRHKDDPESFLEVTYSEVLWSYLDKDVSMAESNDVTYSEVITKVKKCKDADAGVGDATYASVRKKGP